MAKTTKKSQRALAEAQRTAVAKRREGVRSTRERRRQQLLIRVVGSVLGVALLVLLIGVLYDQVYLPSQPIAQVDTATLSRGNYVAQRRTQIAQEVASTLDLIVRFGGQFSGQFAQRIPQLNSEADPRTLRNAAVDDATVNNWIDGQLIERGATAQSISVSDGEVAQRLVSSLNESFPPQASVPVTGTAAAATAAPTVAPTSAATAAAQATAGATSEPTRPPTATRIPTPAADVAVSQQDEALRRLYDAFTAQTVNTKPNLSIDDFRTALQAQYRREALTEKIEAQLVKEEGFTLSTDPSSIEVRQILVKVEPPQGATDAQRDAEFTKRKADAEAILAQVKGGADFATVAKDKSDDVSTKNTGGLLPSFDKTGKTQENTQIDPAIVAAALKLTQPKQIADEVVRTSFGWHIIQLEQRTVPTKDDQLREARSKAFDTWLADQRTKTNVQRFPAVTPTPTAAPTAAVTTQPLPTVPLAGVPTVVTDTQTLGTAPAGTAAPAATRAATPTPTVATNATTGAATAAPANTTGAATAAATATP